MISSMVEISTANETDGSSLRCQALLLLGVILLVVMTITSVGIVTCSSGTFAP